jgi:hypothetical protein
MDEIKTITKSWRAAMQDSLASGDRVLPEAFRGEFRLAWHYGFLAGINRIFAVSAILSFVCSALIWFGIRTTAREEKAHSDETVPKPV